MNYFHGTKDRRLIYIGSMTYWARWDAAWPELPPQATTDDCRRANDSRAATLKRLAQDAYELDAFKPNLTRTEAEKRIAMLTAKLKLLDGPPHTL